MNFLFYAWYDIPIKWFKHSGAFIKAMKLTVIIVTLFCIQVSATTKAQQITLSVKNAPLEKVMEQLHQQTGYSFLYSTSYLNKSVPITAELNNASVTEALNAIFKDQPFGYEIREKTIVIVPKKAADQAPPYIKPAAHPVEGHVTDSTGNALPGVTIRVKGSNQIAITDEKGYYRLNYVSPQATLIFSMIGYKPIEIEPGDKERIDVMLRAAVQSMNAVNIVSTGYQQLPKERATGSFVQLDSSTINRRVSPDIVSRMEGVVPGLIFNRNTLASATGFDLSIRGHSTLFANDQPLIVLDNFPYDGDINNINPNDIESITVLKDAAASSIWGVRSGNGVIVITTKKGSRNGKMAVNVNTNVTIGEKPNLFYGRNFLDANDFINVEESLYAQGYYTSTLSNPSNPPVTPVIAILSSGETQNEMDSQISPLRSIDYRNQLGQYFYRHSVDQQYNVNIRGGTVNSDYFISGGYDNLLSNLIGNNSQRFTLNSIYNFSMGARLDISAGFNFVETSGQNNSPVPNLLAGNINALYPYAQFVGPNNTALPIAKDYAATYTDAAIQNGFLDWTYRPYDELHNGDNTSTAIDNRINLGIRYKAFKGFSVDVKYQYEKRNSETKDYNSLATYFTRNLINQFTQTGSPATYPVPVGGIQDMMYGYLVSQRLRTQANYNRAFGESEINAIAGAELSDAATSGNSMTVYGYDKSTGAYSVVDFSDYFSTNPLGSFSQIPSGLAFQSYSDRYISYFGNAAYSYKKRYVVSLSGRIDKSNLFGVNTNQKSVPLYSAGGSWRLSDEKFYHLNWLPYAKLRLTYGYNGNVDKNVTAVSVIQEQSNSYITGGPYAIVVNPANPELRWEKISMLNAGLDFSLKREIISGSIEYYVKKGIDIIGDSPLPPSTGFTIFRGNTADTWGNGFDLVINSNNIRSNNLLWTTNFMLSYATDKVTKYNVTETAQNALIYGNGNLGEILPITGRSVFGMYSYRWGGLDPANGNPRGYLNGRLSEDYGTIEANTPLDSLKYNGTSRPKYFGSLRNTITYRSFSLTANIIYKLDYDFRRTSVNYSQLFQHGVGNSDYLLRWQKPGDEQITNVPSLPSLPVDPVRDDFYANSSALITSGDFIRLQDVSLSYNFQANVIRRTPFKAAQIYCYINNIGILWRANKFGLDPDLFGTSLPLPRTISFGIKTQL